MPSQFHFVIPAADDAELARWLAADVDRDASLFATGALCWSLESFLVLRSRGLPASAGRGWRGDAVNLAHALEFARARPPAAAFTVCLRVDYPRDPFAHLHLVENRLQADGRTSFWLPHWPPAGLRPRDPARRGVGTVAYCGSPAQLAGGPDAWARALGAAGFRFVVKDAGSAWNDLRDVDLLVGVRSFDGNPHARKPGWKLVNAWLAGIPFLGGAESAYAQLGRPGRDYLVVRSLAEAVGQSCALRGDPARYAALVEHGRAQGAQFTRDAVAAAWEAVLQGPVRERHAAWTARPEPWRRARNALRWRAARAWRTARRLAAAARVFA